MPDRWLTLETAMVAKGFRLMSTVVMRRPWRSLSGWSTVAVLVGGLGSFAAIVIHDFLTMHRDAQVARLAIASGRHKKANEPLAQELQRPAWSAEAHALMAQVALAEGDLARVTDEMNKARSLGYPR